ncbi:MAG: hypothetical protein M1840_006171 [Geoglossum simile]|nr:MAG: hypothetical protein M1840_006171 [Geoglossum simile]
MTFPSRLQTLHAYRHLYRAALRAVQYSSPSRYTIRDHIRPAFRKGNPATFDQGKIDNTLLFLEGAAREKGIEHRILKTLLHVWFERADRDARRQYVKG